MEKVYSATMDFLERKMKLHVKVYVLKNYTKCIDKYVKFSISHPTKQDFEDVFWRLEKFLNRKAGT